MRIEFLYQNRKVESRAQNMTCEYRLVYIDHLVPLEIEEKGVRSWEEGMELAAVGQGRL